MQITIQPNSAACRMIKPDSTPSNGVSMSVLQQPTLYTDDNIA